MVRGKDQKCSSEDNTARRSSHAHSMDQGKMGTAQHLLVQGS